jgi:hypothetical protein
MTETSHDLVAANAARLKKILDMVAATREGPTNPDRSADDIRCERWNS